MSETLRVYHNARCSKSRSACQLLEERGLAFEVVEYLKTPPSRDELAAVLARLGMKAEDIVRKGEEVYKLEFKGRSLTEAEWLDAQGQVLAASDANQRDAFLAQVSSRRAPRISAHWDFLMRPLVGDHSDHPGLLRFRQIEYYRMPQMAYLAMDRPRDLTRSDFVRLGLVTGSGARDPAGGCALPYGEQHLAEFESKYCYDRFWTDGGAAPHTRGPQ